MAQTVPTRWSLEKLVDTEQKKSYFTIIATIVLLIILILLIYPAIGHITKINKEISDARIVKDSLEEKIRNLEKARTNLEEVQDDLALLDLALPVGSDLVPYLQKIEAFAKKYDLAVEAAQFINVPLSKPIVTDKLGTKQLTFNLTFSGDFTDFKDFLSTLENYIRTSEVGTITLSKDEDKLLEALSITTYYIGLGLKETKTNTNTNGGLNE